MRTLHMNTNMINIVTNNAT